MKKQIAIISLLFSQVLLADSQTFLVKGMHCGGCQKMVNKAVCESKELKNQFTDCKVTVNEEVQEGLVVLSSAAVIDQAAVTAAIKSANADYEISVVGPMVSAPDVKADSAKAVAPTKKSKKK